MEIRANQTTEPFPPSHKAKIFVVNLDSWKDRCTCMSFVLEGSLKPVVRHSAATPSNWKKQCPDMATKITSGHEEMHHKDSQSGAPQAFLCSNFLIWQKMAANSESEFTIILEDDIFINSDYWKTLGEFREKASSQDWDVAYVDLKDQWKA